MPLTLDEKVWRAGFNAGLSERVTIGETEIGVRVVDANGEAVTRRFASFDHFA